MPAGLHHRDLRGGPARRRDPALGRRAVLRADRQAAAAPGHRDRDRVQAGAAPAVRRRPTPRMLGHNQLVIRVQPDEGVTLKFGSKVPGTHDGGPRRRDGLPVRRGVHRVQPGGLRAAACWTCCVGDRDAVPGRAPRWSSPGGSSTRWRQPGPGTKPEPYRAGEWGPRAADEMLAREGRRGGDRDRAPHRRETHDRAVGHHRQRGRQGARRPSAAAPAAWPAALALTLVAVVEEKQVREAEAAATIAAAAHPCRLLIVVRSAHRGPRPRLDAEIVVGGRLGPARRS